MKPRQSQPSIWLFADERIGDALWAAIRRLPPGAGVIVRHRSAADRRALIRRIRRIGRSRALTVLDEERAGVARIHDSRELRRALSARTPLIFVSPMFATRSHPELRPLPPMRAATLARLAGRRAYALGGMDVRRFRGVAPLGFVGWGGIDAWLASKP